MKLEIIEIKTPIIWILNKIQNSEMHLNIINNKCTRYSQEKHISKKYLGLQLYDKNVLKFVPEDYVTKVF